MVENNFAVSPSVTGILRCLRFLAEEAALLKLPHTAAAIEDALEAAARESGIGTVGITLRYQKQSPLLH